MNPHTDRRPVGRFPSRIRSTPRLTHFDYRTARAYLATYCTARRLLILSSIIDNRTILTPDGEDVATAWRTVLQHFPAVRLLDGVIMPDHVHVIVVLNLSPSGFEATGLLSRVERSSGSPAGDPYGFPTTEASPSLPLSLSRVIGLAKLFATRRINARRKTPGAVVWQRSFHDRVLRTARELAAAQRYIAENPARWTQSRTGKAPRPPNQ